MTSRINKRKSDEDTEELSLEEAVEYLTSLQLRPKIRGNTLLHNSLEKIESVAKETGLPAEHITQLVNVAASGKFSDSISIRLIKWLIPATVVPSEAICKAVSWMCTNIPSSKIQALLIRWIILIYETLDKPSDLHALYGILFYFLQNEVMCCHVCHLLYLLTRKEDVKLFRVRMLLRLQKRMGNQPYLQGLMSIYRLYCPQYLMLKRTCKVFFQQRDKAWLARIRAVFDRRRVESPLLNANRELLNQSAKRLKEDVIPSSQSVAVTTHHTDVEFSVTQAMTTVPFYQITSFQLLLKNFDRLELPCQMAAALKDRNLQHVLLCHPDPVIPTRIAYWLDHVLCQEFLISPSKDKSRAEELLQMLIVFSEFLKESLPVCDNFLVQYLHIWNGYDYRPLVLKLLTRFRMQPFEVLRDLVLEPLRKLFFSSSVYVKCQVLKVFTQLLHNLVSVELPRYRACLQWQKQKDNLELSSVEESNDVCIFSEEVEEFCPEETLSKYIEYVGCIIEVGLLVEKDNALLMQCMLSFYDVVSDLHHRHGLMIVILPRTSIVYRVLFSNNAVALSRMCQLICRYRDNFTSLKQTVQSSMSQVERHYRIMSTRMIKVINAFILDISNCLWREQAFNVSGAESVFKLVPLQDTKVKEHLFNRSIFALHKHPALLGFAALYVDENAHEKSAKLMTEFKKHRDSYLSFLSNNHLSGIAMFIAKNISHVHSLTG